MIHVFWQDKKGIYSEKIAVFQDDNLYNACLPQLKASAKEHKLKVFESDDGLNINYYSNKLNQVIDVIDYDDLAEDEKIKKIYDILKK